MFKLLICLAISVITLTTSSAFAQSENPDEGLDVTKSVIRTVVDKYGNSKNIHEFEYVVISEAGRMKLTNYRTHFLGPKNSFKMLSIYSDTGGQQTNVDPNKVIITDAANPAVGILDLKQVSIPISNVQIGSKVFISYQLNDPSFDKFFSTTLAVSNASLAKDERYVVESPTPIQYAVIEPSEHFVISSTQEKDVYRLEVKPAPSAYPLVGKKTVSIVVMATNATSWTEINKFYSKEYQSVLDGKLPSAFNNIVTAAKQLKTPKEQIEYASSQLYKTIAYSGKWINAKGKLVPQNFDKLVKSKTGDCKDFSTALVAILRQLNFAAYPAITTRTERYLGPKTLQLLSTLPSTRQFNHAITWAKDASGKVWWVDPTNPLVIADVVSADILGNFALILDGQSQVTFLPEKNEVPHDFSIEQTFKVSGDNSVSSMGLITLNASSYNKMGQYERLLGMEAIKQLVNTFINPQKKMQVAATKSQGTTQVPSYAFAFNDSDIILEEKFKYKLIKLPQPIFILLSRLEEGKDSYVGEIGTFKYTTKIEKLQTIDTFEADCISKTPWIDAERTVKNEKDGIVVSDVIKIKQRIITKEEALSEDFKFSVSSLLQCAQSNHVKLFFNESLKTGEEVARDEALGPSLDKMTDADAYKLLLSGYGGSAFLKLIKYYRIKLEKNPNDFEALSWIARGYMALGHKSSDEFDKTHLEAALEVVNQAAKIANGKYNKVLYRNKIYANMRLGNYTAASNDLKVYAQNEPDKFSVYSASAELALRQDSELLFEQWYLAAGKQIKTMEEETAHVDDLKKLIKIYGKRKSIIGSLEEKAQKDPKDAWNIYMLATAQYAGGNHLKTIETAKKLLSTPADSVARQLISRCYQMIASNWLLKNSETFRMPASATEVSSGVFVMPQGQTLPVMASPFDKPGVQEFENAIKEATTWDTSNTYALSQIIDLYKHRIDTAKTPQAKLENQQKFKTYHEKLVALKPYNSYIKSMASNYPK